MPRNTSATYTTPHTVVIMGYPTSSRVFTTNHLGVLRPVFYISPRLIMPRVRGRGRGKRRRDEVDASATQCHQKNRRRRRRVYPVNVVKTETWSAGQGVCQRRLAASYRLAAYVKFYITLESTFVLLQLPSANQPPFLFSPMWKPYWTI